MRGRTGSEPAWSAWGASRRHEGPAGRRPGSCRVATEPDRSPPRHRGCGQLRSGHTGDLAALTAAEFVDVAVGRAEVAPSLAPLIDVAAEQLHTGPLQLRHGSGEVLLPAKDPRCSRRWRPAGPRRGLSRLGMAGTGIQPTRKPGPFHSAARPPSPSAWASLRHSRRLARSRTGRRGGVVLPWRQVAPSGTGDGFPAYGVPCNGGRVGGAGRVPGPDRGDLR
jgi:hypothetical protein